MAIVYDVSTSEIVPGGSSKTLSCVAGTGANRYMIVSLHLWRSGGSAITSITYNGVALSLITSITIDTAQKEFLYGLVAPDEGTHNLVGTWSAAGTEGSWGASTFFGVDQSTPLGTPVTQIGTLSTDISVTVPSAVGDIVFGACGNEYNYGSDYVSSGASETVNWTKRGSGLEEVSVRKDGAATSTVLTETYDEDEILRGMVGVALKPAAEVAPVDMVPPARRRMTQWAFNR